jgi:hypothetical protein
MHEGMKLPNEGMQSMSTINIACKNMGEVVVARGKETPLS